MKASKFTDARTVSAVRSHTPKTTWVDNGSEFISRDLHLWSNQRGVKPDFARPGKPTDNAFIEAFNSKLRSEKLNTHTGSCAVKTLAERWSHGVNATSKNVRAAQSRTSPRQRS